MLKPVLFCTFVIILVVASWQNRQEWLGYDVFRVESVSMLPALVPNDVVIVNILKRGDELPLKDDIVVVPNPEYHERLLIKRVYAVPGDDVTFVETQSFVDEQTRLPKVIRQAKTLNDIDGYFVVGDNLNHSTDSRHFGVIPPDQILGKVIFIWSR